MLYPHEVFHWLVTTHRLRLSPIVVNNYWDHFRALGVPWAVNHPASASHWPISLYGDEANYNDNQEQVLAFCMSCPLQEDVTTFASRLWFGESL
jgi:hypothetical protein